MGRPDRGVLSQNSPIWASQTAGSRATEQSHGAEPGCRAWDAQIGEFSARTLRFGRLKRLGAEPGSRASEQSLGRPDRRVLSQNSPMWASQTAGLSRGVAPHSFWCQPRWCSGRARGLGAQTPGSIPSLAGQSGLAFQGFCSRTDSGQSARGVVAEPAAGAPSSPVRVPSLRALAISFLASSLGRSDWGVLSQNSPIWAFQTAGSRAREQSQRAEPGTVRSGSSQPELSDLGVPNSREQSQGAEPQSRAREQIQGAELVSRAREQSQGAEFGKPGSGSSQPEL